MMKTTHVTLLSNLVQLVQLWILRTILKHDQDYDSKQQKQLRDINKTLDQCFFFKL